MISPIFRRTRLIRRLCRLGLSGRSTFFRPIAGAGAFPRGGHMSEDVVGRIFGHASPQPFRRAAGSLLGAATAWRQSLP